MMQKFMLRELRLAAGLSLRELAYRSNCGKDAIHVVEWYEHQPRMQVKVKLAKALGSNLQEIWPNDRKKSV